MAWEKKAMWHLFKGGIFFRKTLAERKDTLLEATNTLTTEDMPENIAGQNKRKKQNHPQKLILQHIPESIPKDIPANIPRTDPQTSPEHQRTHIKQRFPQPPPPPTETPCDNFQAATQDTLAGIRKRHPQRPSPKAAAQETGYDIPETQSRPQSDRSWVLRKQTTANSWAYETLRLAPHPRCDHTILFDSVPYLVYPKLMHAEGPLVPHELMACWGVKRSHSVPPYKVPNHSGACFRCCWAKNLRPHPRPHSPPAAVQHLWQCGCAHAALRTRGSPARPHSDHMRRESKTGDRVLGPSLGQLPLRDPQMAHGDPIWMSTIHRETTVVKYNPNHCSMGVTEPRGQPL